MPLSQHKAAKILHDKKVRGKKLTPKQRRFMGAVASGYALRGKFGSGQTGQKGRR